MCGPRCARGGQINPIEARTTGLNSAGLFDWVPFVLVQTAPRFEWPMIVMTMTVETLAASRVQNPPGTLFIQLREEIIFSREGLISFFLSFSPLLHLENFSIRASLVFQTDCGNKFFHF